MIAGGVDAGAGPRHHRGCWSRSCSSVVSSNGQDAGPFSPLEVAILPDTVPPRASDARLRLVQRGRLPARRAGRPRRRAVAAAVGGVGGRLRRARCGCVRVGVRRRAECALAAVYVGLSRGRRHDRPRRPRPARRAPGWASTARAGSSSSSPGSRPSTPSPAGSSPRACSSTGSTCGSAWARTCSAASSSAPSSCPRSRSWPPPGWPSGSGSCARWSSPTCSRTCCWPRSP